MTRLRECRFPFSHSTSVDGDIEQKISTLHLSQIKQTCDWPGRADFATHQAQPLHSPSIRIASLCVAISMLSRDSIVGSCRDKIATKDLVPLEESVQPTRESVKRLYL